MLSGNELADTMRLPLVAVVEKAVTTLAEEGLDEHVSVIQTLLGSADNTLA